MFSLIITIISIALVAALAVATIYYGGDSFSEGRDAADASSLINQAQQIGGAATMMSVQDPDAYDDDIEGADDAQAAADALEEGDYLSSIPEPPRGDTWGVDAETSNVELSGITRDEICINLNEEAGADDPEAVEIDSEGEVTSGGETLPYGCSITDGEISESDDEGEVVYEY